MFARCSLILAVVLATGCRFSFDRLTGDDATDAPVIALEPRFASAPGFTDWIENDGATLADATGTPCDGDAVIAGGPRDGQEVGRRACLHAGVMLQGVVPAARCAELAIRDELDALEWTCTPRGDDAVVSSMRLRPGVTLRDLVDATGWIPNALEVRRGDVSLARSERGPLWPNPVVAIDGSPDTAPLALDAAGTIYTLGVDRASPTITVSGRGAALVTQPGVTVSVTPATSPAIKTAPSAAFAMVVAQVEAPGAFAIQADAPAFVTITPAITRANLGVYIAGGTATAIVDADLREVGSGLELEGGSHHVVERARILSTGGGPGITIDGGRHHDVRHVAVAGAAGGVVVLNSPDARLHDVESANSSVSGIRIAGASPRALMTDIVATNNAFQGIEVLDPSHDAILVGALVAYTADEGIHFNGVDRITASHLTALGNEQFGVATYLGADYASVSQVNAVNNGNYGLFVRGSSYGLYAQLALSDNAFQQARVYQGADFNTFTHALVGGPGQLCLVDGGGVDNNTIDSDVGMALCGGDDPGLSFRTAIGLSQAAGLGGLVTDDATNAHASTLAAMQPLDAAQITDWLDFDHRFRFWGPGASTTFLDSTNRLHCASPETCRAWDARVLVTNPFHDTSGSGRTTNEPFMDGAPCPAGVHGDQTMHNMVGTELLGDGRGNENGTCEVFEHCAGQSIFLLNARELLDDDPDGIGFPVGDEDGLCETNEACVYSPHFGYYQGQGDPRTGPRCLFTDGTGPFAVTGVTMYAHPQP